MNKLCKHGQYSILPFLIPILQNVSSTLTSNSVCVTPTIQRKFVELAPFSCCEGTEIKCLQESKSLLRVYQNAKFWVITIE